MLRDDNLEEDDDHNHKRKRLIISLTERLIIPKKLLRPAQSRATATATATASSEVSPPLPILPSDLIREILSRVPLKFLLRFRCVCKSWKSLISDPQFVKQHLHISNTTTNLSHHRLLLITKPLLCNLMSCSLQSLFHDPSTIPVDFNCALTYTQRIVGCCNGLLCLANSRRGAGINVCLWNPSTRLKSEKSPCLSYNLQELENNFILFGFGYDNLTGNYKVLSVYCDPSVEQDSEKTEVKVYTFGGDSWRKIQSFPWVPVLSNDSGKFASGTLNWVATRTVDSDFPYSLDQLVIISFDLGKETYKTVSLPDLEKGNFAKPTLGVLRDCLCFSYDYRGTHFVVWLMKEYAVKESWTKLATIPYFDLGIVGPPQISMPLFISENGDILLRSNLDNLILYNPRDGRLEILDILGDGDWYDVKIYNESLVSPCCSSSDPGVFF